MFFQNTFPIIKYGGKKIVDIFRYVDIKNDVEKDQTTQYLWHNISEGDRPDVVSYKLYGTTDYYWTFFVTNTEALVDANRGLRWYMTQSSLEKALEDIFGSFSVIMFRPQSNDSVEFGYYETNNLSGLPIDLGMTIQGTDIKLIAFDALRGQLITSKFLSASLPQQIRFELTDITPQNVLAFWKWLESVNMTFYTQFVTQFYNTADVTILGSIDQTILENHEIAYTVIRQASVTASANWSDASSAPYIWADGSFSHRDAVNLNEYISYAENFNHENEKIRRISVIAPSSIGAFASKYRELIAE